MLLSALALQVLNGVSLEVDRLNGEVNSEITVNDKVVLIKEPFTAGLVAIRLYPSLWPSNSNKDGEISHSLGKLRCAILKRLKDSQPKDGGGWPFFDRVLINGHEVDLIAPDADTTAVCWAALLLASEVGVDDCKLAFQMICDNLSKDGDVYFDRSGRLDLIALCNMLFFFMLYCEKHEEQKGVSPSISNELMHGLLRARKLLLHILALDTDQKAAYWLRYYVGDNASAIARICGFISPLVLRWPEHDFIAPIKYALENKARVQASLTHSSFTDSCMLATVLDSPASMQLLEHERDRVGKIFEEREPIFFTVLHKMAFVSSVFNAACFLAPTLHERSDYCSSLPNSQLLRQYVDCNIGPQIVPGSELISSISQQILVSSAPEEHENTLLRLACSSDVERLKDHFNQSFSPTISHRSLPDALVVSEVFRRILERGLCVEVGSRMKTARELLLHCLILSRSELEGYWTTSQLRLQLSVLLTLKRFPNSDFLRPLEMALYASVAGNESMLRIITNPSCLLDVNDNLQNSDDIDLGDVVINKYVHHILTDDAVNVPISDDILEACKFESHLNYHNLKMVMKQQFKNQEMNNPVRSGVEPQPTSITAA